MPRFEPFHDWADLTACVPADATAASLNALGAAHAAFWPLWLDEAQSLGELFLSARFTSRSFRYGGLADNVLGLSWILPNGQKIDLGGRVVKNVTGFDLVRFLCASQGRFGRPETLILRLRPLAPVQRVAMLKGPWNALEHFVRTLRASSWAHALDAMDLHDGQVYVAYSNEAGLIPLFEKAARAWAQDAKVDLSFGDTLPVHAAQPWARVHLPLGWMLETASAWPGATGFLGQGLLHLPAGDEKALVDLHAQVSAEGGHVEHPSIKANLAAPQARWEQELLNRLATL
jgi:FAD/FMN-containing dehydrogenase